MIGDTGSDDSAASAFRVLDTIATYYSEFQYKHTLRLLNPNTRIVSTAEEELRRVVSAIELLLVHNGVGKIDEITGEYRSGRNEVF